MGTLFSTLDIGRAGLQVAQVQLDVAAHNISNVNTEGYSRQRANIITRIPNMTPYGAIGRGPLVAGIERLRDPFLDRVFRQQAPGLASAEIKASYFNRIEDVFQEPSDDALGTRIGQFFDALNDFANNVEELPVRVSVLSEAQAMTAQLNQAANRLAELRTNTNEEVRNLVPEINSLAERIADMNVTIQETELTGREANDLRDRRDVLVDDLARLVNITTQERDNGNIDVFLGGDELVVGRSARLLEAVPDPTIDPDRPDLLLVRFVDSGRDANITDGELAGVLEMRDVHLREVEDKLDTIAQGLILSINRIHSEGNGLENISATLESTNAVNDPNAALNSTGLPFPVQDGSFDIVVYDSAGNIAETRTITIDDTTTSLNDIAAQIDASPFLDASVDSDGFLSITPTGGATFTFSNDTSDALPALGLNGLFTGSSAATIGVSQHVLDNPLLLSSGYSTDPTETGDNEAALDMAAVRNTPVLNGDSQTIDEFYESTVVQLGIDARANNDVLEVERAFVEDVEGRRQEVAGVNLDEEVTTLIQFQRAFEASARVITITDRMLETLMGITA
ncbi:MAG: flagellar hook-associated protein FlgK [Candidatus Hydrogenedentes bacterium]|nr:flagellar hook-associated protein FlgK [Candidatus Hydrogenedentota bacterium]